jgi:putative ABC transport system permease protein
LLLVHLLAPDRDAGPAAVRELPWSYPKYEVFRDQQRAFSDHAAFSLREWNLTGTGEAERLRGEVIGSRYLTVLGITPRLGRDFTAADDKTPGMDGIVMLGHEIWQRRFGADPSVIGRVLHLSSRPYTVVGVLPPGFRGLTGEAQLWVPLMTVEPRDLAAKWNHWLFLVARRQPQVTGEQAREAIALLGPRIDEVIGPPPGGLIPKMMATATPLDAARVDPLIRRSALVLLAAVGFVLLIGCVNLANLMAARGAARQREVAVRLALGATRGRLVRQFLTESLLLAGTGALLGLGVAYAALTGAAALLPESGTVLRSRSPGLTRVSMQMIALDSTTLWFAIAAALVTALLFGLLPAWRSSRANLPQAMKTGAAGSIGRSRRGFDARRLLIVTETALALVLLVASGLMIQSVRNLQQTELGFRSDGLITLRLQLARPPYDAAQSARFFDELLTRVAALPGVEATAFGSCAPVSGGCDMTTLTFPDRPAVATGSGALTGVLYATPELFRTLGVRLLRGRVFTPQDSDSQTRVVVINETLARQHFGRANPIGQRIALGAGGGFQEGAEVVGVVSDLRYVAVETAPRADTYVPLMQFGRLGGIVFIRTSLDPSAIVPAVRREVAALDRNVPLADIKTMKMRFEDATWRARLSADVLALFAGLALLLAAIGIYGVMAQAVQQRTPEIGLRLALGAGRGRILRLVLGGALSTTMVGIAVGVALSLASMRLLESLLYEVRPHDPTMIGVLAGVLLAVALLASYIPARRAMRVDPLTSLRAD